MLNEDNLLLNTQFLVVRVSQAAGVSRCFLYTPARFFRSRGDLVQAAAGVQKDFEEGREVLWG